MAAIPRPRGYKRPAILSPAILSYGFRPLFLADANYTGLELRTWIPLFFGDLAIPTAFAPVAWHVHEMLSGYLAAVITGFLPTAIPNWTGRLPLPRDKERRLASGGARTGPMPALAGPSRFLCVHVDTVGAAVDLRRAGLHQFQQRMLQATAVGVGS